MKDKVKDKTTYENQVGIKKLKAFNPSVTFSDMGLDFFNKYKFWLLNTEKLSPATTNSYLRTVRKFIKLAQDAGLMRQGNLFKAYKTEKTGDRVRINLNSKTKLLLFKYEKGRYYGPVPEASKQNKYLKEVICMYLGMDKPKICLHSGRHTFGIVGMMIGMDRKTVQKIMGHSTSATTEIYQRVAQDFVNEEMNLWNKL